MCDFPGLWPTPLTDDMIETLGSYVYLSIDPRDGEPFYIAKGTGDRFLRHLYDAARSATRSRRSPRSAAPA